MTTTIERLGIDIELKPTGEALVDAAIKRREQQAKASNVAIEKSARAAAEAQKRHEREIASEARAAAAIGRAAKRGVAEETRKVEAAARSAGRAEVKAAQEAAAAQKALAREVAATAAAYQRQQAAAAAAFGNLSHAKTARGPHRIGGAIPNAPAGGDGGGSIVGGRLAAGLGAALGAREIADMADSYTNATNRLQQLHKDTATLTLAQRELFNSAQEIGVAYGDHVALYQKVGKAAMGLGRSQKQALDLTDLISKAIKSSGAEGASAAAALQQLGQAFDSGVLRGEEFNSVSEQAPIILELMSKSLGKSRGELRKMADAGQLTAAVVIAALEKQGAAVDEAFGKRIPTINEQFVRFNNELSKMFGELSAKTGVVNILGAALGGVADQLRSIAEVAGLASSAVGLFADLAGKIPGFDKFTGAAFGDKGFKPGRHLSPIGVPLLLKDSFTGDFDPFDLNTTDDEAERAQRFAAKRGSRYIVGQQQEAEARRAAVEQAGRQSVFDDLAGKIKASPVGRAVSQIPIDSKGFIKSNKGDVGAAAEAKRRAEELKQLREEYDRFGASLSTVEAAEIELSQTADLLHRAMRAGFTTQEEVNEQMARKKALLQDQLDPLAALYRGMQEEAELLALGTKERETEAEYRRIVLDLQRQGVTLREAETLQLRQELAVQEALRKESEKQVRALEAQRQVYDDVHGSGIRYREMQEAARRELDRGALTLQQYNDYLAKLNEQYGEKRAANLDEMWKKALPSEEYLGKMQELRDGMASTFGEMGRGLMDLALEGKKGFEDLAESAITAMQKIALHMSLLAAAKELFGSNSGGFQFVSALAGSLFGGGMAGGGTYQVPGGGGVDSRNVMFRVTPGERITFTPPGAMGPGSGGGSSGGGAAPVNVLVRNINVGDARGAALEALSSAEGERVLLNFIDRNADALAARLLHST